jgi:hypothetical protein
MSLPAIWNGRFYMIGNGSHASEALDDTGRVAERNTALRRAFPGCRGRVQVSKNEDAREFGQRTSQEIKEWRQGRPCSPRRKARRERAHAGMGSVLMTRPPLVMR